jgi:hypothetical protein
MFVHTVLQSVLESCCDLFDGLDDLGAFSLCGFAIDVRDIVQVDDDR